MPRIIVSAGHENIGNITADKIGQQSADNLRSGTGALGKEAQWNGPWADMLVALLKHAGVDAIRTDAIYHPEVYATDADLVIFGHCDGTGTKQAQWCMAGPVKSGGSTDAADARAQAFCDAWYASYPGMVGIKGNGPITVDMTQYYGGWYRTQNTPAVLIEHFILGNGGVWSGDLTPQLGASADAAVVLKFFGITNTASLDSAPPQSQRFPQTGHGIGGGFYQYWLANGGVKVFGYPLTDEYVDPVSKLTVQDFERARFERHPGSNPADWDVQLGRVNAELIDARQKLQQVASLTQVWPKVSQAIDNLRALVPKA